MSSRASTDPGRRKSGMALAGTIGGYVALSILVGLGAGYVLDRLLHTAPLFLIVGVLLGFLTSFYLTYRIATGELGE